MIESEIDLLRENELWQLVLETYRSRLRAQKDAAEAASVQSSSSSQSADVPDAPPGEESMLANRGDCHTDDFGEDSSDDVCTEPAGTDDENAFEVSASGEKPDDEVAWVPRIVGLEGVASDELSQAHGRLIAWGFLQFQLTGRTSGLQYQLTRLGKHALNQLEQSADGEVDQALSA